MFLLPYEFDIGNVLSLFRLAVALGLRKLHPQRTVHKICDEESTNIHI